LFGRAESLKVLANAKPVSAEEIRNRKGASDPRAEGAYPDTNLLGTGDAALHEILTQKCGVSEVLPNVFLGGDAVTRLADVSANSANLAIVVVTDDWRNSYHGAGVRKRFPNAQVLHRPLEEGSTSPGSYLRKGRGRVCAYACSL
jgi:hypothetical protein